MVWIALHAWAVTEDITLYAASPLMHLRGKSLDWVVYPDGPEQTILDVPKFDFSWQIQYELTEPLHIPAGARFWESGSTTTRRKTNGIPRPIWKSNWSEQGWDEMYQLFTAYSVDSQMLSEMTVTKER